MAGELADDEETAVTIEDKFRTKVFNIIDKLNQSMANRSADHKYLYLDLSCLIQRGFLNLSNVYHKMHLTYYVTWYLTLTKTKLESFVQDWPQISSSLTVEYTRDADMESDSESETSEEIVQNEVRTCIMEDPCKKYNMCCSSSNTTNYNLEAFLIMQCERDKHVALDNDMVIDKLCEQSEEMRRLLVL
ncbi:hypothetical protein PR048_009438 [Dryococelus australis]|uniref:Uncharacterized protein n=1 Tax=Dryococelus australis TaxID=614101 RepID=A0ABQ9HZV9_9NEOP|nr:hypothetical protein PR048_009438 [Dryococelus australis]